MTNQNTFFMFASICAFIYVIITVVSAWLYSKTKDAYTTLEKVMEMRNDPMVSYRNWIVLFSFFFVLVTYAGIALRIISTSSGLAIIGFSFCLIFVIAELLWRSIEMFAFRQVWLPEFAKEEDGNKKAAFEVLFLGFGTYRRAIYFVLMTSCALGTTAYGIAIWSVNPLDMLTSIVLFLNSLRLLSGVLEMHFGIRQLSKMNRVIHTPAVTITYLVIGLWLALL